jgi:hypothetical protein
MYTNFKLSIRHWRVVDIETEIKAASSLLEQARTFSDKLGYVKLLQKDNIQLFVTLSRLSMFEFHLTNGGSSCYLHQIILYLSVGWKLYRRGKFAEAGSIEVHHLDHDPSNNSPDNLWYVSPLENKLLAHNLAGAFNLSRTNGRDPFRAVRNSARFVKLRILTAWKTLARLGMKSFVWFSID